MGQLMCQSRYDQRGRSLLELGRGPALAVALLGSASEHLSPGAEATRASQRGVVPVTVPT
jgi:hypothetical protein